MKNLIIISVIFLTAVTGFSQGINPNYSGAYSLYLNESDITQRNEFDRLSEEDLAGVEGTPYSNEEFLLGNVYQNDKLVLKDVYLRYNSYADEIEMKRNSTTDDYGSLLKNPETFVKIFKDVYIFVPLKNKNDDGGYFKIVTSGKHYDLYKKTITAFKQPVQAKTTYQQNKPARFDTKVAYFLMSKDGKLGELPTSRNKAAKVMSSKKDEVKNFIDKNKLDLDNEADLARLVDYFNSIL